MKSQFSQPKKFDQLSLDLEFNDNPSMTKLNNNNELHHVKYLYANQWQRNKLDKEHVIVRMDAQELVYKNDIVIDQVGNLYSISSQNRISSITAKASSLSILDVKLSHKTLDDLLYPAVSIQMNRLKKKFMEELMFHQKAPKVTSILY